MKQKVALTAAHLLGAGRVADMGMGSGSGSEAIAALYPGLDVVGVDVNPTMVELARQRYRRSNLSFITGDIASEVLAPESCDGIVNSSVLHHVTSFNGYQHRRAADALNVQVKALRMGGVLIVRDFVDAAVASDQTVMLDLPHDDGDPTADADCASRLSTADLLRQFGREFRSLSGSPGFELIESPAAEPPLEPGRTRFLLSMKLAQEFILRKDYRRDWDTEVQEEYTYFTQEQFEAEYARLGLRVLASTPIWNPWIVTNRYRGRLSLWSEGGEPIEFPPTNYVIVGERVRPGEGVKMREASVRPPLDFLKLERFQRQGSPHVWEVVRRPNLTVDVLPWFEVDGDVLVLARMSYPRPVLASDARGSRALTSCRNAHYVTEPLSVIQTDQPIGLTVERALYDRAGIPADAIRGFDAGSVYYPSPGGLIEEVRSVFVEVTPTLVTEPIESADAWTATSGRVRAIEARQLLRAAQVGGLPDARLELNVYDLLLRRQESVGAWIGDGSAQIASAAGDVECIAVDTLLDRPARRAYRRANVEGETGFIEICSAAFDELSADGTVVASTEREWIIPRRLSTNTVAFAVVVRIDDRLCIGVDDDDLLAAQCITGNSQLLVAPAWRIPKDAGTITPALGFALDRLSREYGVTASGHWPLGERYHPSAGVTPEVVHPYLVAASAVQQAPRALRFVDLGELVARRGQVADGHLSVVMLRAAHALGVI